MGCQHECLSRHVPAMTTSMSIKDMCEQCIRNQIEAFEKGVPIAAQKADRDRRLGALKSELVGRGA